jgi:hypothetical protein
VARRPRTRACCPRSSRRSPDRPTQADRRADRLLGAGRLAGERHRRTSATVRSPAFPGPAARTVRWRPFPGSGSLPGSPQCPVHRPSGRHRTACTAHPGHGDHTPGPDPRVFSRQDAWTAAARDPAVIATSAPRHRHHGRPPVPRNRAVPVAVLVAVRQGSRGIMKVQMARSGRCRTGMTAQPRTLNPRVRGSSPWRRTRPDLAFLLSLYPG